MTQLMTQLLAQLNIKIADVYFFGHIDLVDDDGSCFGIVLIRDGHLITKFWASK